MIAAGLLLTAVLLLAQIAGQWIDLRYFGLRLRILDSNHHASVFGVASLLAQAAAAAAIALRARPPRGLPWLLLAGVVGVLLVVRTFLRPPTATLVLPVALVFVSLCWLTRRDPAAVRVVAGTALCVLVASFALHLVGPQAHGVSSDALDHTWTYQVTGIAKHGAELAGWMLLGTAMAAAWANRPAAAPHGQVPGLTAVGPAERRERRGPPTTRDRGLRRDNPRVHQE